MAFFHYSLLFLFSLCLLASAVEPEQQLQPQQRRPGPRNLVVTVRKDEETGLHLALLLKRAPPVPIPLVVDINGPYVLVDCERGPYLSASYNSPPCRSTQCSLAAGPNHACFTCSARGPPRPGCHNGTCGVTVSNPLTRQTALGELAEDALTVRAPGLPGRGPPFVTLPQFLFVCAPPALLRPRLPQEARGVAGLGHSHVALPNQLASRFGLPPTFATCLGRRNGAAFFGSGPYFPPGANPSLTFTPLTVSQAGEYFITLNGIKINNKVVRTRVTRALISTTVPYTVLEHTIYSAVKQFFYEQYKHAPQVTPPVAPFGLCFNAAAIANMPPPAIDLLLAQSGPGGGEVWRILRENSLVEARRGVMCLAFVDGGRARPGRTAITIGAYQLEEILVQIDLRRSVLGFSSSLLRQRSRCSNFNS